MLLEELVLPLRTDTSLFKSGLKLAAAGVAALVAGMGLAIKASFNWAEELDSLQDIMGGTNKTAAALNFVLRKSKTDTNLLTQGMTILAKGLVKADGSLDTTGKALKAWGVNVLDANGMLKDQTMLLGDISEKYSSFATQQEKVNFLTEVFGKSGAKLVDFFDTLSKEGGIDEVAKKVERLGLAIDPNRYEKFSRSLEELKLIGLGLAVAFTEKAMPALESFLGWFNKFAANPDIEKLARNIDRFIGIAVQEMANKINTWISGDGPQKLSDDIVSWIENIGTGAESNSRILTAAENVIQALVRAFGEMDWTRIGNAIGEKLGVAIDSVDWAGLGEKLRAQMTGAFSKVAGSLPTMMFSPVGGGIIGSVVQGFMANVGTFYGQIAVMAIQIEGKLRDVAKVFFIRALAWTQQLIAGFLNGLPGLMKAITSMVAIINGVLRKIITSFTLSIKMPDFLGGGSLGGGGGGAPSIGVHQPNRPGERDRSEGGPKASGGPVIAGLSYLVGEHKPEMFTPTSSGRIDALKSNQTQQVVITNWQGFNYGALATAIIKAQNSA